MGRFTFLPALLVASLSLAGQEPAANNSAPDAVTDTAPLPAMGSLLLDVERNALAAESARKDYTYRVHVEQQELDGKGNTKKTTTIDSDSLTIDGVRIDRVTARNGKPLTPDETKKESERIDKEVAKDKERRAKLEGQGKESDSRGDQIITAARILELGTFSNPRRVMMNGRPTIVADYAGDPKAKTRNAAENVIKDLVGTVWIDEHDHTLARSEGHFVADYKIGGGLVADIRKGSRFEAQFAKINGEVWLPTQIHAEGKVRILLFAGFNGTLQVATSDYRKFRSTSTIVGSSDALGPDGNPLPDPVSQPQLPQPK
jgi:hypothetical protein